MPTAEKTGENKVNKVKIRLFKDGDKYKDDVFVAVNGKAYQIKRGVEVEVPDYIAQVLRESEEQDAKTNGVLEDYEREYREQTARYGG